MQLLRRTPSVLHALNFCTASIALHRLLHHTQKGAAAVSVLLSSAGHRRKYWAASPCSLPGSLQAISHVLCGCSSLAAGCCCTRSRGRAVADVLPSCVQHCNLQQGAPNILSHLRLQLVSCCVVQTIVLESPVAGPQANLEQQLQCTPPWILAAPLHACQGVST